MRAQFCNNFFMPRAIEHADDDFFSRNALFLGNGEDIFCRRLSQIDNAGGVARADRELFHIDIGRIEEISFLGNRQNRHSVRTGLSRNRGAFERIASTIAVLEAM